LVVLAIADDTPDGGEAKLKDRLGRVDVAVPVHVWSQDDECVLGVTRNICVGGMFVATLCSLPIGSRVLVRISVLDGVEPVDVEAQVCWARRVTTHQTSPAGMGLVFLDPIAHAALFVRQLVGWREGVWA
jgi:hypothetical protein